MINFSIRRTKHSQPDLIPLVSVVFLLLIFFLVAGTVRSPSYMNLDLPSSTSSNNLDSGDIRIYLDKDGKVSFEKDTINLEDFKKKVNNKKHQITLQVHADKNVDSIKLVDLLDALGNTMVEKVALVTETAKTEDQP